MAVINNNASNRRILFMLSIIAYGSIKTRLIQGHAIAGIILVMYLS